MGEIWRDIPDYDGKYEVSNLGRVRTGEKILKPLPNVGGYLRVGLHYKKRSKYYSVHHLVLRAFVGERPEGYHIEHIDHDKTNNRLENIQYVTPRQNYNRGIKDKRYAAGDRHAMHKLTEKQAMEIKRSNLRASVLAPQYNVSQYTINEIKRGRTWKHL